MQKLRIPFDYNADLLSDATALHCVDKSLTHQSFADECDINTIIDRFGISGELPQNLNYTSNDEFVEIFDFQSAQNQIIEAEQSFMQLPAKVRYQFQNDAGKFVQFCSDANNVDEMIKLGLAIKYHPKDVDNTTTKNNNINSTNTTE
ncbi:MAG: internal scaffolding protein [Microvirus sp.]|nr:MAG: internal scaffolding protein [Microvirus sp.]